MRVQIAAALFGALRFFLRLLPPKLLLFTSSSIGGLVGRFCRREMRISLTQLEFAFGGPVRLRGRRSWEKLSLTGRSRHYHGIALDVFRHFGECVGEALICDRLIQTVPHSGERADKRRSTAYKCLSVSGEEFLHGVLASGRAAVGLSGHFGSFELMAYYLVNSGLRMSVVGRKPNNPVFARLLEQTRKRGGVNMIWRHDPNAARQIIEAVHDKQVIAVLLDQDINSKNYFSPFFGLEAACPAAPLKLAVTHQLPVFTCFISRTARMRYSIATDQIHYPPQEERAAQFILEEYNARLEHNIRSHPEQWAWWHRRWRRRPGVNYNANPDLLPSTSNYLAWLGTVSAAERNRAATSVR